MMKRLWLLTAAAVFFVCSGVAAAYNPYAPNPFDTMERTTWEYQYLCELTKDGLTGADMEKFSPSYPLTRYEMVPMVERAILNRNKATEEQQKKIDRLAQAFMSDLEAGGVALPQNQPTPGGESFDWKKGEMI